MLLSQIARRHGHRRTSGFSLIEIVVAVSILAILAAAVAVNAGSLLGKGKTAKVLSLIDSLKSACAAHHGDTGKFAIEYSGYSANYRQLSAHDSKVFGWAGPYLESPLTHEGSNPFGGQCHMYNTVKANNWVNGFDVDGDGKKDVTTEGGNMLYMSNVPEDEAETINNSIDGNLKGNWKTVGRVRYDGKAKRLLVLVYY